MSKSKDLNIPDLEKVINEADYTAVVNLAGKHRSKKFSYSFCNQLKSLKDDELKNLMQQLLEILTEYLKKHSDENEFIDWAKLDAEQCKQIGLFIQATSDIGQACVQCDLMSKCSDELKEIAIYLHDIMLPMPDNMDFVKNSIAQFCEKLFLSGLAEGSADFLSNVVIYLLTKVIEEKKKSLVKRICAVRRILKKVMERNNPNTGELWRLFICASTSPSFLSVTEGPKVLYVIMTLDNDRLLEIHETIIDFFPRSNIQCAIAYGQIYFEAWCHAVKNDNIELKETIELTCLNEFLNLGLKPPHKYVVPLARKIFLPFFLHKKNAEVSKVLINLYLPAVEMIIPNANGMHRSNATQFLIDVFPLENPDSGIVANQNELHRQLLLILQLLNDEYPIVRITAVLGLCLSMSVNWEVYPEETLKTIFRNIVNDLSRDSVSAEVRVAVVKGLKCLLENPLTMRCLVNVLMKLSGLFHDIDQNVRIAFCQLLIRIKSISSLKYFEIVPPRELFARMEEDCHAVKKSLTNLIHNSYFPKHADVKVCLGRCLELIREERIAARVFFSYVSNFIGVEQSVKFMVQAIRTVHFYVKTKSSSSSVDIQYCDKENIQNFADYINSLEAAVGFDNIHVVRNLMESIACMWLSLKPETDLQLKPEERKNPFKMLVAKLKSSLPELCLYYKDSEAWEPMFYLGSFLPPEFNPQLSSLCFYKIKNLPSDAKPTHYGTLIECLANQVQLCGLINLIKEWIEAGLSDSYTPPPAKRRQSRSRNSESLQDEAKPYLGNRIIDYILDSRMIQKRALLEREALLEIVYLVDHVKRKIEKNAVQDMNETEAEFLCLLIYNIIRISAVLHVDPNSSKSTSVPFLNEFVKWTDQTLVKQLSPALEENNHFRSLIITTCKRLCLILADLTSIGCIEPDNCLYLDFAYSLLNTSCGYQFFAVANRYLYKHGACSQLMILLHDDKSMMEHHLPYLCKVLVFMTNTTVLEKVTAKERRDVTCTLASLMQIVQNYTNVFKELVSQAFTIILKSVMDSIADKCAKIVEQKSDDPFDNLTFPLVGHFFWSVIIFRESYVGVYIKYLREMLIYSEQDIDVSQWIAYWFLTWKLVNLAFFPPNALKNVLNLIAHLQECILRLCPDSQSGFHEHAPVPVQMFQHHCHAEIMRLKKVVKEKIREL